MILPIKFTESAIKEVIRLSEQYKNSENSYLRIGVKGGGCSGMTYILGFDKKEDDDAEFEYEGVKMLLKPAHELYLAGMEIDYKQGLDNRGFTFNNPNATSTCGCGTSFAV